MRRPQVSSAELFQPHIDNGTPRLRGWVIGPDCTNSPNRPSLRSRTAVPPLNRSGRKGQVARMSVATRKGPRTHAD